MTCKIGVDFSLWLKLIGIKIWNSMVLCSYAWADLVYSYWGQLTLLKSKIKSNSICNYTLNKLVSVFFFFLYEWPGFEAHKYVLLILLLFWLRFFFLDPLVLLCLWWVRGIMKVHRNLFEWEKRQRA